MFNLCLSQRQGWVTPQRRQRELFLTLLPSQEEQLTTLRGQDITERIPERRNEAEASPAAQGLRPGRRSLCAPTSPPAPPGQGEFSPEAVVSPGVKREPKLETQPPSSPALWATSWVSQGRSQGTLGIGTQRRRGRALRPPGAWIWADRVPTSGARGAVPTTSFAHPQSQDSGAV